jgi:hypothetical protein
MSVRMEILLYVPLYGDGPNRGQLYDNNLLISQKKNDRLVKIKFAIICFIYSFRICPMLAHIPPISFSYIW